MKEIDGLSWQVVTQNRLCCIHGPVGCEHVTLLIMWCRCWCVSAGLRVWTFQLDGVRSKPTDQMRHMNELPYDSISTAQLLLTVHKPPVFVQSWVGMCETAGNCLKCWLLRVCVRERQREMVWNRVSPSAVGRHVWSRWFRHSTKHSTASQRSSIPCIPESVHVGLLCTSMLLNTQQYTLAWYNVDGEVSFSLVYG